MPEETFVELDKGEAATQALAPSAAPATAEVNAEDVTQPVCTVEVEPEQSCAAEHVAAKQTYSVQQEGQCQWDPVLELVEELSLALVQMGDGQFEEVEEELDVCVPKDISQFINDVSPNDKNLRTTIYVKKFPNGDGEVFRISRWPQLPNSPKDNGETLYVFVTSTVVIIMVLATIGYRTYKSLAIQEADAESRRIREDKLLAIQEADAATRRELENEVIGAGLELAKKSRVMGDYTALVESLNKRSK